MNGLEALSCQLNRRYVRQRTDDIRLGRDTVQRMQRFDRSPERGARATSIVEVRPKRKSPILLERTNFPCGRIVAGQEPQFQSTPEFFGELNFLQRGYVRRQFGIRPPQRRESKMRRSRTPSFSNPFLVWTHLAWRTSEMMLASAQVLHHRTVRMAAVGVAPSGCDRREFVLMGQEKIEAGVESAGAMAAQKMRMNPLFGAGRQAHDGGEWRRSCRSRQVAPPVRPWPDTRSSFAQ